MLNHRCTISAAIVVIAYAVSPSRTTSGFATITQSSTNTKSPMTMSSSPSNTPSPSSMPVLSSEEWGVIDTSDFGDGVTVIPQTLLRDLTTGGLYLQLVETVSCLGGSCPTDVVTLWNAWFSGTGGYYPNTATQGSQNPTSTWKTAQKDYISYWWLVRLATQVAGYRDIDGVSLSAYNVSVDLFDATGTINYVTDAHSILDSWDVFAISTFQPYATASACIGAVDSGWGNIDLTGTAFRVHAADFGIFGLSTVGGIEFSANNQIVNLHVGGNCGMAGPVLSTWPRDASSPMVAEPPSKRNMRLDALLLQLPSSTSSTSPSSSATQSSSLTTSRSHTSRPTTASASLSSTMSQSQTVSMTPSGTATMTRSPSGSITAPGIAASGVPGSGGDPIVVPYITQQVPGVAPLLGPSTGLVLQIMFGACAQL